MGELKKLGIKPPSRNTVKNILKQNGLDPGPKRGQGSWDEFLQIHSETLWQCDFFSKLIWTPTGLRQYFSLVFLHVGSRKVFVTTASKKPDTAWMRKQAKAFLQFVEGEGLKAEILMRDRDNMYVRDFDNAIKDVGIRIHPVAYRSPNQNAFVEQWIQSIKHECLNHFIVFGEDHFNYLISQYVEHYLAERPHQGLGNRLIDGELESASDEGEILCRQRLGGVLKHYYRAAA
jgi:putative transposase